MTNLLSPVIPSAVTPREASVLAMLALDRLVLECGSQFGYSTIVMSQTARQVVSVDTHRGDEHAGMIPSLNQFRANLKRYHANNVVYHVGTFADVLPKLDPVFEFAFLDGFHTAQAVAEDIGLVAPLLIEGSFLAVHDWGRYGVAAGIGQHPEWILDGVVDHLAVLRRR